MATLKLFNYECDAPTCSAETREDADAATAFQEALDAGWYLDLYGKSYCPDDAPHGGISCMECSDGA